MSKYWYGGSQGGKTYLTDEMIRRITDPREFIFITKKGKVADMVNASMGDISDPGTMQVKEDAVGFYLGGNTPHVWSAQQVHMQAARYRHPIWVYGKRPGGDGGRLDALDAVAALHALGAPKGITVSIDMETKVDDNYCSAFDTAMQAAGFHAGEYGSADFVTGNPLLSGGRWLADWTGTPHFTGEPGEWACQWQRSGSPGNEQPWDISAVRDVSKLWDIHAPISMTAILVNLPTGSTKVVHSTNNGVSWS